MGHVLYFVSHIALFLGNVKEYWGFFASEIIIYRKKQMLDGDPSNA